MKKLFTACLLLLVTTVLYAQTPTPAGDAVVRPSRTEYPNQVGVKFDVMASLAQGGGPELTFLTAEYSRYGWNNLGFRAGLKVGLNEKNTYALPLHLSWRVSPRTASNHRDADAYYVFPYERPRADGDTHRYYYNPYHTLHTEGVGDALAEWAMRPLAASAPVAFDLHAGFTPGLLGGSVDEKGIRRMGDCEVQHRFMCSLDAGARAMFQVWHFGIALDVTYQLMLTNNFRYEGATCSRHYINVGAGVVYRF